eukprot:scaffold1745_cov358-Prasinococcus_capsulatus_cf.AAC.2
MLATAPDCRGFAGDDGARAATGRRAPALAVASGSCAKATAPRPPARGGRLPGSLRVCCMLTYGWRTRRCRLIPP